MPWVRLDDRFGEHPKVDRLSDAAFRLHVTALCYAARHLTDGRIDADRPARLIRRYRATLSRELEDAGLWRRNGDGWVIHDFTDWNHSREWWQNKREQDRKRQEKSRRSVRRGEDGRFE